jgi:DNA-binding CsgD family transcriptional regulator
MNEKQTTTVQLTRLQRRVAEQRALGRSRREIALMLGVSIQAVKKHLSRARKRAVSQEPALERYARAMPRNNKRTIRFRPFSLLPTDHA